jgi:hypothetical protein
MWGIVFFLNPISILITGFHSQVDNIPIALAFGAWLIISSEEALTRKRFIISALLLALSLVVKHAFLFFPIWLLFNQRLGSFSRRVLFAGLVYGVFFVSFIPFIFEHSAQWRIINKVFLYTYFPCIGQSWSFYFINHFFSLQELDSASVSSILRFFFVFMILLSGWLFGQDPRRQFESFFFYLISLVTWTPQIANQYLAIPVLGCIYFAIMYPRYRLLFAMYVFVSTVLLTLHHQNIGVILYYLFGINPIDCGSGFLTYHHCQVWLFILWGSIFLERFFSYYKGKQGFFRRKGACGS